MSIPLIHQIARYDEWKMSRPAMVAVVLGAVSAAPATALQEPRYDADPTRVLVESMIDAHGGLAPWVEARAVAYDHVLFMSEPPPGATSPWMAHREVVDQSTRRVYQDYPLSGARLVDDGETLWTVDWNEPTLPQLISRATYYFAFAPWLTQDDGVVLEAGEPAPLPGVEEALPTVAMSFQGGGDRFLLYIDPTSHRLRGLSVTIADRALLDAFGMAPDIASVPGPTHVYRRYLRADGLLVPAEFETFSPDGREMGQHVVNSIDLGGEFDEAKMRRPSNATVVRAGGGR